MNPETRLISLLIIIAISTMAMADSEEFAEAERLIEEGRICEELTREELESIGHYYHEMIYPDEEHNTSAELLGGEGSKKLRETHYNMGEWFYCSEQGRAMIDAQQLGPLSVEQWKTIVTTISTLIMILGIALLLILVWGLILKLGHIGFQRYYTNLNTVSREDPLEILTTRLAKGEISRKEYLDLRGLISGVPFEGESRKGHDPYGAVLYHMNPQDPHPSGEGTGMSTPGSPPEE